MHTYLAYKIINICNSSLSLIIYPNWHCTSCLQKQYLIWTNNNTLTGNISPLAITIPNHSWSNWLSGNQCKVNSAVIQPESKVPKLLTALTSNKLFSLQNWPYLTITILFQLGVLLQFISTLWTSYSLQKSFLNISCKIAIAKSCTQFLSHHHVK